MHSCERYASIMFCDMTFYGIPDIDVLYPRVSLNALSFFDPRTLLVRKDALDKVVSGVAVGSAFAIMSDMSLNTPLFLPIFPFLWEDRFGWR